MNSTPLISIIIPVYNSENTIKRCIDSIPHNKSIEIICINDGSNDSSLSILQNLSNEREITIIDTSHMGVSHARNEGIIKSNGKYIHFIDSDDYLKTNYYEKTIALLSNDEYDCIIIGAKIKGLTTGWKKKVIKNTGMKTHSFNDDMIFNINGLRPFVWKHIVKKSILIDNDIFFNEKLWLGEDQDFIIRYMHKISSAMITKKTNYLHTIHNDSSFPQIVNYTKTHFEQHLLMIQSSFTIYNTCSCPELFVKWIMEVICGTIIHYKDKKNYYEI